MMALVCLRSRAPESNHVRSDCGDNGDGMMTAEVALEASAVAVSS